MTRLLRIIIAALAATLCAALFAGAQQPLPASDRSNPSQPVETPAPGTPTPAPNSAASPAVAEWDVASVDKLEAARGEAVTVVGNFPGKPTGLKVVLSRVKEPPPLPADATPTPTPTPAPWDTVETDAKVAADGKSLVFYLPHQLRLGRYDLSLKPAPVAAAPASAGTITAPAGSSQGAEGGRPAPIPFPGDISGAFKVVTKEPITISAVHPTVSYYKEGSDDDVRLYTFTVLGEGFSPYPEDNTLIVKGVPKFPTCVQTKKEPACGRIEVGDGGRELKFIDFPIEKLTGPLELEVRVGDRKSSNSKKVTLSWVRWWAPLLGAVGTILGVALLVAYFLKPLKRGRIGKYVYKARDALFLDKETNTYSLSKLQFYVWTLAGVFGYVYLTVAKSLIQGNFEFADIPKNLPGILAISAGTGALAVGIQNSKGSKGAGEMFPSRADFITTGGVVAAERLQFLVWTVLGVLAFLFLIVIRDPGMLSELPTIPEGFLFLMGVSSFGYLGGKLARKPGPVIKQIGLSFGSLTLEVHGTNLSPAATFRLKDVEIKPQDLDPVKHPEGRAEVVVPKAEQSEFAEVLRLTLIKFGATTIKEFATQPTDADAKEYLKELFGKESPKLTITNPDGQKAEWPIMIEDPATSPVKPPTQPPPA